MLKFDHAGIVVANIDAAADHLGNMLGPLVWTRRFDDFGLKVAVKFARDSSGLVYELIEPLGDDSPIRRTLEQRRNLLNQLAYRTDDLEASAKSLRLSRATPIGRPAPAIAFGGKRVQFFLSPLGFIVELIEGGAPEHDFSV